MERIDKFSGERAFLSNFFVSQVGFEGMTFPTSEHAFQAAKTEDREERMTVRRQATPGKAKRAGRKVCLRPGWDAMRLGVMETILIDKFFRSKDLKARLLATGDAELVEGNRWHDNFWGVCTCTKCKDKEGLNHLGQLLMKVRDMMRPVRGLV